MNYTWKVEWHPGGSGAAIIANKCENEIWNNRKILFDCFQMAQVLISHAGEIRDWKKRSFKRSMKQEAEKLRVTGNIHGLFKWMMNSAE